MRDYLRVFLKVLPATLLVGYGTATLVLFLRIGLQGVVAVYEPDLRVLIAELCLGPLTIAYGVWLWTKEWHR